MQPRFAVQWAQRSRATNSPASALSGELRLVGAQPNGTDAVIVFNRNPGQRAPYSGTYTFADVVNIGTYTLRARFYAEADAQGALVAEANVPVAINSNGSGIGDITLSRVITKVTFPPQEIPYPGLRDLQYIAQDTQGNIVAVSPGSVFYRIQSGSNFVRLTSDQYAEGIAPGMASLIASIDGQDSLPGPLQVDALAVLTIMPTDPLVAVNSEIQLSASVANVSDQTVRWQLKQADTGSISADGVYRSPDREGNFTVVATSVFDPRASAEVVVRVRKVTLPIIIE